MTGTGPSKRARNPLARVLKTIGYLTDPATAPGKAFTFCERRATALVERLAQSDTYLSVAGGAMTRGFRARAQANSLTEEALRAMRLPTSSEVHELRAELRQAREEIEALSAQMEVLIQALDARDRRGR